MCLIMCYNNVFTRCYKILQYIVWELKKFKHFPATYSNKSFFFFFLIFY